MEPLGELQDVAVSRNRWHGLERDIGVGMTVEERSVLVDGVRVERPVRLYSYAESARTCVVVYASVDSEPRKGQEVMNPSVPPKRDDPKGIQRVRVRRGKGRVLLDYFLHHEVLPISPLQTPESQFPCANADPVPACVLQEFNATAIVHARGLDDARG